MQTFKIDHVDAMDWIQVGEAKLQRKVSSMLPFLKPATFLFFISHINSYFNQNENTKDF